EPTASYRVVRGLETEQEKIPGIQLTERLHAPWPPEVHFIEFRFATEIVIPVAVGGIHVDVHETPITVRAPDNASPRQTRRRCDHHSQRQSVTPLLPIKSPCIDRSSSSLFRKTRA